MTVDWLDIQEQDRPELMLPRVMDVHGALLRLGCTRYDSEHCWQEPSYIMIIDLPVSHGLSADRNQLKFEAQIRPSGRCYYVEWSFKLGTKILRRKGRKLVLKFNCGAGAFLRDVSIMYNDCDLYKFERFIEAALKAAHEKLPSHKLVDDTYAAGFVPVAPAEALKMVVQALGKNYTGGAEPPF